MTFPVLSMALLLLIPTQSRGYEWPDCQGFIPVLDYKTEYVPECGCDVTFHEITCRVRGPSIPMRIAIYCTGPNSNFSAIPNYDVQHLYFTVNQLSLKNCELPSTFASMFARMLAQFRLADAVLEELRLEKTRGQLTPEHVKDLRAVRKIVMMDVANQTRLPYDVFEALPELETFQIFNLAGTSQLQLETRRRDDAPLHTALQSVELVHCGVTDVPTDAFATLPNVTYLSLGGNLIKSFTSNAFRGLENLKFLSLTANPLVTLPPRAFEFTPSLRRLDLIGTHLNSIPGDVFQGLKQLEQLNFQQQNDGKHSIELHHRLFADLSALKELSITSVPLKPLANDLLEDSKAIEELVISTTSLEEIPNGFFRTQQRLQSLDLSRNKIKALESDVFRPLIALVELKLDNNNIEELPDHLFSDLRKLKSVSINNNSLIYIAARAFLNNIVLSTISFNYNNLTSEALWDLNFFSIMITLNELHLRGNRLSRVIPNWQRFDELTMLDLSWNNFTELEEMHLMFHSKHLVIDLRHNQITNVMMNQILPGLSETKVYNTHVLLGDNPFECDCNLHMFIKALHLSNHHFISALKLDPELAQCASPPALKGNIIRNLPLASLTCVLPPTDCPTNCTCKVRPEAQTLELDCQAEPSNYPSPPQYGQETIQLRLRSIQQLTLPSHVVSLNLTELGLTEAPPLSMLHTIKELDLSRNALIKAPMELLKANMTLRLTGNPFACDCSNLNNVYALRNNSARIADVDTVMCSGRVLLTNVDVDKLCEINKETVLSGILAAIGLLITVLSGFFYRYSLEIKMFLHSRGWCQFAVDEDDLEDAQYDAFVSFSQEDAQWVAEQLLPKLEGEPNNFKLCVHYRDWAVGDMIPAQIAASVEQSKRTIVVLTDNFLRSMWAPLEFRAANARAQRIRQTRVLVIVLGDIPDDEGMDAELRAYLTTNTYLKWGDPWFWEKLVYAMPRKR